MARFRVEDWSPNAMERKCLAQLDSEQNWEQILKRPRPADSQLLDWRPFIKIFAFNLVFFSLVLTMLLVVASAGSMGIAAASELWRELAFFTAVASLGTALYTTHLYRRSWNRRAQQILVRDS